MVGVVADARFAAEGEVAGCRPGTFAAGAANADGSCGVSAERATAEVSAGVPSGFHQAQLGPDLQHLSRGWRFLLAYLLTDEAYATTAVHYANKQIPLAHKHWFYLGAGMMLWLTWQTSTAVGVFLGAEIPASWGLDFALALTFIGIVVPLLTTRPMLAAAVVAGITAVLAHNLPYNLGLVIAGLAGIGVGVWMEKRNS